MTQFLQLLSDVTENDAVREKLIENKDKVYFPNFGSGDNILKEGISINRVMFTIPGTDIQIYWYGFLIAIGILLAMIYGFRKMKSVGIDPDRATDAVIGGIIGAIIGARTYYIVFNTEGMKFSQFFDIRDGGLAIYGGIIGAILVGGIIAKLRKLKLSALLDVVAQHVACGDVKQVVVLDEVFALSAFAGARSSENYDVQHSCCLII